ncbi:MAG TPA: SDR family oxidoreductase [Gemmatimonadaceae bacterium]|nr:SDR family oxidoreductase [Gemmatimonadaceae bacterium]
MNLSGRVALVTGAGRRVGQAIALALGAKGMKVAVHYHDSASGAEATVAQLSSEGATGRAFQADLSAADGPAALIAAVAESFGGMDVVVNSAAIMERTPFGEVTPDMWDAIMAINLRAPFFVAQAAAPHLRKARGCLVNIADLAAYESWPAYIPHGISKAGVVHMTRSLARVMAPDVRVNGVAPGTVLLPESWDTAADERLRQTTPLARTGTPEDVSSAVIFLLESDYITGETIIVDGGRHIRI